LDRAVPEDVVRQLADDLAPLLARQGRAVERELLCDRTVDAVGEVLAVLFVQLRTELRDALVVDPCLELGVRVDRRSGRLRAGAAGCQGDDGAAVALALETIVEPHLRLSSVRG